MRNGRKNPLFYKHFVLYLILFIVPAFILSSIFLLDFMDVFKEELINKNINKNIVTQYTLDIEIEQLRKISLEVATDKEFRPFTFDNDPYKSNKIIERLRNYCTTNTFIDSMFIYYPYDDYLYTSSTSASLDMFSVNLFNHSRYEPYQFIEKLKTINTIDAFSILEFDAVNTWNGKLNLMTFLFPLTYDYTNNRNGVLGVIIKEGTIRDRIYAGRDNNKSYVVIKYKYNEIVYYDKGKEYGEEIKGLSIDDNFINNDYNEVEIDNKKFNVTVLNSEVSADIVYYIFNLDEEVYNSLNKVKNTLTLSIIIAVIIGAILIIYGLYYNYLPVRSLYNYAQSIFISNGEPLEEPDMAQKASINDIKKVLDCLSSHNMSLTNKFNNNYKYLLEDNLVTGLLQGKDIPAYKINDLNIKTSFDAAKYCCCAILDFQDKNINLKEVIDLVHGKNNYDINSLCKYHTDIDKLIIVSFITGNRKDIKTYYNILLNEINNNLQTNVFIGLGKAYHSIGEIPISYRQANLAIDRIFKTGQNHIIEYKDIKIDLNNYRKYVKSETKVICSAVSNNDLETARKVLAHFTTTISENNISGFPVKVIGYNMLIEVFGAINESIHYNPVDINDYSYMLLMDDINSFTDLPNKIIKLCQDQQKVKNVSNYYADDLLNKIIEHINANYTNYDFSIQALGEEFGMSSPNICRYFQLHFGTTILSYITSLRINKATELLINTDYGVNDIAEKVGYLNQTTLTRRFKKVIGVTPSKYRNLNK